MAYEVKFPTLLKCTQDEIDACKLSKIEYPINEGSGALSPKFFS